MATNADQRYRAVLLFGAPGTGKGTQGQMLAKIPGFYHLATGDIFRSLDKTTELGKIFASYSSTGSLVPDDITMKVWRAHVGKLVADEQYDPQTQLLLLDGMPRSVPQVEAINGVAEVLAVIHLVPDDIDAMVKRMQLRARDQGRADDAKEEVVRNRFTVYDAETHPVLDCYDKGLVHEVSAMGSPAMVLQRVLEVVSKIQFEVFGNTLK